MASPPKPEPGQVIEIDPPLATASGRRAVDIEWFFAYLHRGYDPRRTTSWLTGRMENLINPWADTVPEADFNRLRARFTVVAEIPGHPGTSPEPARMLQELAYGSGYSDSVRAGRAAREPHLVPNPYGHTAPLRLLHAPGNTQ